MCDVSSKNRRGGASKHLSPPFPCAPRNREDAAIAIIPASAIAVKPSPWSPAGSSAGSAGVSAGYGVSEGLYSILQRSEGLETVAAGFPRLLALTKH